MKLVSHIQNGVEKLGILVNENIFSFTKNNLPQTMASLLNNWENDFPKLQTIHQKILQNETTGLEKILLKDAKIIAPVPHPTSCRDAYAFRQHVAIARRNRGQAMIPAFDEYPVFYFTNHNSVVGPGYTTCMPDHFEKLDFELEAAIAICKTGRNIKAENADAYIGGLMIMNDLSARQLQLEEMLLNLGPAKGKDFATAFGPWLVTLDELTDFEIPPKANHIGKNWNLDMKCWVKGVQVSQGNLGEMDWTFAEIIERASYGVDLYPGDIIGSGTVGTGCFLELNGTAKLQNPNHIPQWLQPNDVVEMEITGLGKLQNTLLKDETDWSILKRKKI